MTNPTHDEMLARFETAMSDFHQAMQLRDELTVRIARRTTQIIRVSLLLMIVLSMSLFYLVWSLSDDMDEMTVHMISMSDSVARMEHSMNDMNQSMLHMNQGVVHMNQTMTRMQQNTQSMSSPMRNMPFWPQ